jgi:hypothetical protein
MPYMLEITVFAGTARSDHTQLQAQLVPFGNPTHSELGTVIATFPNGSAPNCVFKTICPGWFAFHCDMIPDQFQGYLIFSYAETVFTGLAVNPTEVENADVATSTRVGYGNGSVLVSDDYNGNDFRVFSGGVPVDGATLVFYTATNYTAGNTQRAFIVAITTTNPSGSWVAPVSLDPGNYTLVISSPGTGDVVVSLTVVPD